MPSGSPVLCWRAPPVRPVWWLSPVSKSLRSPVETCRHPTLVREAALIWWTRRRWPAGHPWHARGWPARPRLHQPKLAAPGQPAPAWSWPCASVLLPAGLGTRLPALPACLPVSWLAPCLAWPWQSPWAQAVSSRLAQLRVGRWVSCARLGGTPGAAGGSGGAAGSSSGMPTSGRHTAAMPSCIEATTTDFPCTLRPMTGVSTVSAALPAWPRPCCLTKTTHASLGLGRQHTAQPPVAVLAPPACARQCRRRCVPGCCIRQGVRLAKPPLVTSAVRRQHPPPRRRRRDPCSQFHAADAAGRQPHAAHLFLAKADRLPLAR